MPNSVLATSRKPVVLMTMGAQPRNGHAYQVMTHKYIMPLVEISGCVPLLVPTCCGTADLEQDRDRDLFDLPLIKGALARGLPILGICRGMQEINVALGGDIHQKVYTEPGYDDHREDADDPVDEQYGPSHQIELLPGSWFAELMGAEQIPVNSLHGQGLNRLGAGLEPLAHAEDGLVEAIHAPTLSPFLLAVQWHPEWKASENPHSIKIFQAFGDACRRRQRDSH